MVLTIELTAELESTLVEAASAHGQSPADYVLTATERQLSQERQPVVRTPEERARLVKESLDALRRSGASLGRDNKPWREFIHEGHRC